MMYTTQKQIRSAFWDAHPSLENETRKAGKLTAPHNRQNATVRSRFVDFLDYLHRTGQVSDALADRATL